MKLSFRFKATIVLAAVSVMALMLIVVIPLLLISSVNNDSLGGSAGLSEENPERIEELMLLNAFGVPMDVVMMVTTYISENDEDALTRPYIFPGLEFLTMTENIYEYVHHHEGKDPADEDYHEDCGWELKETNYFRFKAEILGYIGIPETRPTDLNAGNLLQTAQEAADIKAAASGKEQMRTVSFSPLWAAESEYSEAIKRCIDFCDTYQEADVKGIWDLFESKYFAEWILVLAGNMGLDPGESTITGGNTHFEIGKYLEDPEYTYMPFFGGETGMPISGGYSITSEFGPRDFAQDPNHTGIDFAADTGTPIRSVMDGIVLMRMTYMSGYGHYIVIFHGGGITTMYAHMSAFGEYKVGDSVSRGDIIGYVGSTGLSTGPHLHFEYQSGSAPRNPRDHLPLESRLPISGRQGGEHLKKLIIMLAIITAMLAFPLSAGAYSGEDGGQYYQYADNYSLDLRKTSIMEKPDAITNSIANLFFGIIKGMSKMTADLFQFSYEFNLANLVGDLLNDAMGDIADVFFGGSSMAGLFVIAFAASAVYMLNQFMKGNLQNFAGEAGKVIVILLISSALSVVSTPLLTQVNEISNTISESVLSGLSGTSNGEGYAASAAETMWTGLAHRPWIALEFYGQEEMATPDIMEDILSTPIMDREDVIEGLYDSFGLFDTKIVGLRLSDAFWLGLPTIIKSLFFMILALIKIGFQAITLFFMLLLPLFLFLAISPQLGGMAVLGNWLKKVLETQVSIILFNFIIGFFLKIDEIFMSSGYAWLLLQWLEIALIALMIWKWQEVIKMLGKAQRRISHPQTIANNRNAYESLSFAASHSRRRNPQRTTRLTGRGQPALAAAGGPGANYNNAPQYYKLEQPPAPPLQDQKTANEQTAPKRSIEDELPSRSQPAKQENGKSGPSKRDKNINFNKVRQYQSRRQLAEPAQRPLSTDTISPGGASPGISAAAARRNAGTGYAGNTTSETPQRANKAGSTSAARSYTPSPKTSTGAAQGPRMEGQAARQPKETAQAAKVIVAPRAAPSSSGPVAKKVPESAGRGAPEAVRGAPDAGRPQHRRQASIATDSSQFSSRNIAVEEFNFKPPVSTARTAQAPGSSRAGGAQSPAASPSSGGAARHTLEPAGRGAPEAGSSQPRAKASIATASGQFATQTQAVPATPTSVARTSTRVPARPSLPGKVAVK
jgi:murein DD-endopeptidase MepM/ murein hydrolase activator NlpD